MTQSQLQTRQIEANGIDYFLIDEGDGAPVLLLHGFPDTSSLWREQIRALVAAGFRAIAPDLRGRGRTQMLPNVADYALFGMLPDLDALLDKLDIQRAHVVGHDFGAALAWTYAALRPQRVDHLMTLSVGHPGTKTRPTLDELQKGWYRLLFLFEGVAEDLVQQDDWYLLRTLLPGNVDLEAYIADLSRPGALTAALNWYRANLLVTRLMAPAPPIPPVLAPTLGLWSAGDLYVIEDSMRRSGEFVTGSWRYERIEDASHWIPLDVPERVNQLLLEFLPARSS